ncbi:MAG TPA: hypothetical protein VFV10_16220 [Gammaproteobacteria bacterium]|nr:hypothetical protein [Gammaproteobacteria bacterium]
MTAKLALLQSAVVTAGWCISACAAAQSFHYSDSSSADKLQTRVGVALGDGSGLLDAGVTLVGQGGETEVLPKLTFESSDLVQGLDIESVLRYADWNAASAGGQPTLDTKVAFDAGGPVDKVEGALLRTASGDDASLSMRFSEHQTDFSVLGGDALGVRGGVTVRDASGERTAVSTVRTSLGLGSSVNVESALSVQAEQGAAALDPALDARVVYNAPLPFVERIEGTLARGASGDGKTALSLLFPELASGGDVSALKVETKATLEELTAQDGDGAVRMGLTTKLTGLGTPLLGGTSSLILTLERGLDADPSSRSSSLAYDQTWAPGRGASVGFNFKVQRDPNDIEPTMGVKWLKQF